MNRFQQYAPEALCSLVGETGVIISDRGSWNFRFEWNSTGGLVLAVKAAPPAVAPHLTDQESAEHGIRFLRSEVESVPVPESSIQGGHPSLPPSQPPHNPVPQPSSEGLFKILSRLDRILKLDSVDAHAISEGTIAFPPNIDRKRVQYASAIRRAREILGLSIEPNGSGLLDPGYEAFKELQKEPLTAESPA